MNPAPQMRVVPAGHGWLWLRKGFPILGRHVLVWLLLVFVYWTAVSLVYRLPYLGPTAFLLTTPAFTLSFMAMAREVDAGRPLHPRMLWAGFSTHLPAMLTLGGVYLIGVLVAMGITNALHGDVIAELLRARNRSIEPLLMAGITFAVLYAPLTAALWFAPALVGWHNMPASKALFFSFFATWRNWRALLVYFVGLFALWAIALGLLTLALRVFAPSFGAIGNSPDAFRQSVAMLSVVALPIVLAGFALQFISYYLSYRTVFPGEAPAAQTPSV